MAGSILNATSEAEAGCWVLNAGVECWSCQPAGYCWLDAGSEAEADHEFELALTLTLNAM